MGCVDVEELRLIVLLDAGGEESTCSRSCHPRVQLWTLIYMSLLKPARHYQIPKKIDVAAILPEEVPRLDTRREDTPGRCYGLFDFEICDLLLLLLLRWTSSPKIGFAHRNLSALDIAAETQLEAVLLTYPDWAEMDLLSLGEKHEK